MNTSQPAHVRHPVRRVLLALALVCAAGVVLWLLPLAITLGAYWLTSLL